MHKQTQIYCAQGPEKLAAITTGKLSGHSFVFKDLFDVKGYVTGAGNPTWLDTHSPAKATSPIIEALLSAGANCVGRVQTDELAYSLNGQNIHYGTPINPVAPDCIPGGSSSGSAVAVAMQKADFSIGTDTGGSVRVPASYCGLFGLRPSLGKLSLAHCFELAASFDTAGIFSRDLPLLQDVYQVLSGDPISEQHAARYYLDNSLAVILGEQRLMHLQQCCMQANIELLRGDIMAESGWQLDELSELFRTIQGYEIIQHHEPWLSEYGDSLDPAILARVNWSREITKQQYQAAQVKQDAFRKQIHEHLLENNLLWVLPTTPSGPPQLTMEADALASYRSSLMGLTSIAGLSGFPQLHIPIPNLAEGPCGISLLGMSNQEMLLLSSAKTLIDGGE